MEWPISSCSVILNGSVLKWQTCDFMSDCCVLCREPCSEHLKRAILNRKMYIKQKICLKFWRLEKRFCSLRVSLQFFSIVYTHFLKACLMLSELYTQIKKHTHNGQNPSILLQNETLHSKQCYFFSKVYFVFKWKTQTIIWIDNTSSPFIIMTFFVQLHSLQSVHT